VQRVATAGQVAAFWQAIDADSHRRAGMVSGP